MKSTLITATALLGFAAIAVSGTAHAADYSVHFDRSQLESVTGTQSVRDSIADQARDICLEEGYSLREVGPLRRCENKVMDIVVEQIGNARLSAFHTGEDVNSPIRLSSR